MRALAVCKTRIRKFKTDMMTKYAVVFDKSHQGSAISRDQHSQCVEILADITDLPHQGKSYQTIKAELKKVEPSLFAAFPPKFTSLSGFDTSRTRPPPPSPSSSSPTNDFDRPPPSCSPTNDFDAAPPIKPLIRGVFHELIVDLSDSSESDADDHLSRGLDDSRQDDYNTVITQLEVAHEEQKQLTNQIEELTVNWAKKNRRKRLFD
jgi:hypothetical protein